MASHRGATFSDQPYTDPNPLPSSVPHVEDLGVTSAPLKSAAFFIGQHCKDVNGECQGATAPRQPTSHGSVDIMSDWLTACVEDFMLCKAENRDPAHCLAEGRKVTRCATEL